MKGSLKTVRTQDHCFKRTNFNDWSDPKYKYLKSIKSHKQSLKSQSRDASIQSEKTTVSAGSQTSLYIEELRQKIRSGYALLTKKEIRNVKLPLYQSLLMNLKEDGFIAAYEFIKDLIELDDDWHKQRGKDSAVKNRPFLKTSTPTLHFLRAGLIEAELAKLGGQATKEAKQLLSMAIKFSDPNNDSWYWLAEELYEQCVAIFEKNSSVTVDQEMEAVAKHAYAEFLLNLMHDLTQAKRYVEESMALSAGKSWNDNQITGEDSDILYFESCLLLHKIYLEMSREQKLCNIEDAIELCRFSLQWAKQINNHNAEATALMNLAQLYMVAKQFTPILSCLERYMKLCTELKDIQGLCEGFILKAMYYKETQCDELVIKNIEELLKIAEENHIMKMVALAHQKLAKFYLGQGDQAKMQEHAIKAYNYYIDLQCRQETDEMMCLTGIAHAQEIMAEYLSILLDADSVDSVELNILIMWKNLHIPFFVNLELFQPEVEENNKLKQRMEMLKNEELLAAAKSRQSELMATRSMSMRRMTMYSRKDTLMSSTSRLTMNKSTRNFQRQIRNTILD